MKITQLIRNSIIALHNQNYSSRQISSELAVSQSSVIRTIQKFRQAGSTDDSSHSGRPRLLTERDERRIARSIRSGVAKTASQVSSIVFNQSTNAPSVETVRRALHRQKLYGRISRRKPKLTKSHMKKRLEWAKAHLTWSVGDWSKVLFSDESKICRLQSGANRYCWREVAHELDTRAVTPTVKFGGGSIMVWGCMCAAGVGWMCKIDDRMDASLYRDILEGEMMWSANYYFPESAFIFQQDNDPKHKSKIATQWLQQNRVKVLDWPSNSPDLNPIEHIWHILNERLAKAPQSKNLTELWELTEKEWESISAAECSNLISSMPRRVAAVLQARGGNTKY